MEFREVQRQVFDLYGKGRYDDGLEVIAGARAEHRDQDGRLTFWQACLLGMSGRPRDALEVLEAGLDRGLWWAPGMLADSDLDSVRTLPEWDDMLARSEKAAAEKARLRPDPQIRIATASTQTGTLITLHGAGNDPAAHAELWEEATPGSWTVITPAGNVPMAPGEWAWPFDLSLGPLVEQLEGLQFKPPLVLAGWSQGGGLAASMAWTGPLNAGGLLLVGPGLRNDWDPGSHRRVPTYIVIGENDLNLARCLELRGQMTEHEVPVFVDERPDLGHEHPENFAETIVVALDWLVGNSEVSPTRTTT